jgi:hypothetical protein
LGFVKFFALSTSIDNTANLLEGKVPRKETGGYTAGEGVIGSALARELIMK